MAKFYSLTRAGRTQMKRELADLDAPLRGHQPGGPGGLKCARWRRSGCASARFSAPPAWNANSMRNCASIWISRSKRTLLAGMAPDEARRAALRAMGDLTQYQEECRDMRGVNPIENLLQDLRYSMRTLRQAPGSRWSPS